MGENVSQCDAILAHLQAGRTITPLDAYALYGSLSLHSRCAELRKRGHIIECELVKVASGKTVGQYRLVTAQQAAA